MQKIIRFCQLLFIVIGLADVALAQSLRIVDKPIIFDEERSRLSLEYLEEHYGITQSAPDIHPKMVVVHWTVYPTLEQSFQAFYQPTLPASRASIQHAGALNVSSQYMIDRDGTIYQLMPDTLMARHVIGLNYCAIGIENIGDGQDHPLTEAQFEANVWLIRQLVMKHPIDYVIGHHEYRKFIGHPLWKEKDPTYLTEKDDPGDDFMARLHDCLSGLDLEETPR